MVTGLVLLNSQHPLGHDLGKGVSRRYWPFRLFIASISIQLDNFTQEDSEVFQDSLIVIFTTLEAPKIPPCSVFIHHKMST